MNIPWDKTHTNTLKRTVSRDSEKCLMTIIEDPASGGLNPIPLLKLHLSKCHPQAVFFHSKSCVGLDGVRSDHKCLCPQRDISCFPGAPGKTNCNVGKTKLGEWMKDLAKLLGVDNHKCCTNHGLRKLCIAIAVDRGLNPLAVADIARHSSLNSQAAHAKQSNIRKGMTATGASASGRPQKKKKVAATSTKTPVIDLESTQVPMVPSNESVLHPHGGPAPASDETLSVKEKQKLEVLLKKAGMKPLPTTLAAGMCPMQAPPVPVMPGMPMHQQPLMMQPWPQSSGHVGQSMCCAQHPPPQQPMFDPDSGRPLCPAQQSSVPVQCHSVPPPAQCSVPQCCSNPSAVLAQHVPQPTPSTSGNAMPDNQCSCDFCNTRHGQSRGRI